MRAWAVKDKLSGQIKKVSFSWPSCESVARWNDKYEVVPVEIIEVTEEHREKETE